MKRDELKKLGLTDEQIDKVMDLNGNDINGLKADLIARDQTITALTTERDGLKDQVTARDKDIDDLKKSAGDNEGLSKQLSDLQTKYDTDTADLKQKLENQAREHAEDAFFSGYQFTSAFAKKAAMAEFRAAKLELKDGKFIGAEDFMKTMQEQNKDAFKAKEEPSPKPEAESPKTPKFTAPLQKPSDGGEKNPFAFNFTPVRNANPGAK